MFIFIVKKTLTSLAFIIIIFIIINNIFAIIIIIRRERLEKLSALRKIKPVDMTTLSQQVSLY